jgi:hypothetical protein
MSARIAEVIFFEVICDTCVTSHTYSARSEAEAQAQSHDDSRHPTVELEDA